MSRISVKKLAELQEATGKEIEIYAIGRNIFELQFGYYNKLDKENETEKSYKRFQTNRLLVINR